MEITLKYYGKLVELIGKAEEVLSIENITVKELILWLENEYPELNQLTIKIAQNNRIGLIEDPIISTNIDVFPPFSGG